MKALLFFLLFFTSCMSSVFAEDVNELKIQSETERVTVFLTGAELAQTAKVNIKKGKNLVRFTALSSKLDPGSIVVDLDNKNVVILSVFSSNNFLSQLEKKPAIKEIHE
jgi:hypothetical protein